MLSENQVCGEPAAPYDVTPDTWSAYQAAGFSFATNLAWPTKRDGTPEEDLNRTQTLIGLCAKHGEQNILIGYPWNPAENRVDPKFADGEMRGIYIRQV